MSTKYFLKCVGLVLLVVLFLLPESIELNAAKCPCKKPRRGQNYPLGTVLKSKQKQRDGGVVKTYCTNASPTGDFIYTYCPPGGGKEKVFGRCVFEGGQNSVRKIYDKKGKLTYIYQRCKDGGKPDNKPWKVIDNYFCLADCRTYRVCWNYVNGKWVESQQDRHYTGPEDYLSMSTADADGDGIADAGVENLMAGLYTQPWPNLPALFDEELELAADFDGATSTIFWDVEHLNITFQPGNYVLVHDIPTTAIVSVHPAFDLSVTNGNALKLTAGTSLTLSGGLELMTIAMTPEVPARITWATVETGAVEYMTELFNTTANMQDIMSGFTGSAPSFDVFVGSIGAGGTLELARFDGVVYEGMENTHLGHSLTELGIAPATSPLAEHGVRFIPGHATGFEARYLPNALPTGAFVRSAIGGVITESGEVIATSELRALGPANAELQVNYAAAMTVASVQVVLLDNLGGILWEYMASNNSVVAIVSPLSINGERWRCDPRPPNGLVWKSTLFEVPVVTEIDGILIPNVSEIVIIANNPVNPPHSIETVDFSIENMPDISIGGVAVQFGEAGPFAHQIGTSTLDAHKPELTIGGIGSSGNDGAAIALEDASFAGVEFAFMLDEVPATGSSVSMRAYGTLLSATHAEFANFHFESLGSTANLSADFSPAGAFSFSVSAFYNGIPVTSATGLTATFASVVVSDWATTGEWNSAYIENTSGASITIGIVWDFDQELYIDGNSFPVIANELRINSEPAADPPVTMHELRISGINYPDFGIFNAVSGGSIVTSVADRKQGRSFVSISDIHIYPNPSGGATTIDFALRASAFVNLAVYDMHGRKVADLQRGALSIGRHSFVWKANGKHLPSGVYYCRIESTPFNGGDTDILTQEIVLQR